MDYPSVHILHVVVPVIPVMPVNLSRLLEVKSRSLSFIWAVTNKLCEA